MKSYRLSFFILLPWLPTIGEPVALAQSDPPSQKQDPTTPEIARIKPIYSPMVPFPMEALEKHVEGTVLVNLKVEANGEVSDVKPLSGPPELYPAAIDSAKQWKFAPQAHAVDVRYEINYFFSRDKECPGPISDAGEFLLSGRMQSKNGLVVTLDDDYDGDELLWYYAKARKARDSSGDMIVSVRIGPDGKVQKVRVIKSLSQNLDRGAVAAVHKWRFTLKSGNPEFLPDDFEFTISFRATCFDESCPAMLPYEGQIGSLLLKSMLYIGLQERAIASSAFAG